MATITRPIEPSLDSYADRIQVHIRCAWSRLDATASEIIYI